MSGGGHIFDMIKRLQNNEVKRKGYFKKDVYSTKGAETVDTVKASPEELKAIRKAAIAAKKNELNKAVITLLLSILAVSILVIVFLLLW